MAVYDISGLADWVAANSISRSKEERFGSRDRTNKSRDKRVVPTSSHQDTPDKSRTKLVIPSSMRTTSAHHSHHSPPLGPPPAPAPLPTTRVRVKKVVRFTESVQEREERKERGRRVVGRG